MDTITDLLKIFIAFRSVGTDSAEKQRCLDWIGDTFLGARKDRVTGEVKDSPYLFLPHPQPKLLWFGHTDVVPGSDDQFALRIDGDRVYGRGVKDMKGADLCFLIAYREACEAGAIPPVSILLTSDEETGGHTPPAVLDQKVVPLPPVAFTPDTGEADGIVNEMKGAVWARLIAGGKSGHAAMPWKSRNPIPFLMETVLALQKEFPSGSDNEWRITVTPTRMSGSDAINRIPEEAICVLDIRFPEQICKTPAEALAVLSKHLPSGVRLEPIVDAAPMFCDPDHPMVQTIKRIGEEVTGLPVPILREHGSSDARVFTARGIPAFLYGPVGGDLHGAKEWVSIKSMEEHVEINRRLLKELSA